MIVAPPGAGKTTLLTQIADGAGCPVASYHAETRDRDRAIFAGRLRAAFAGALVDVPPGPLTPEEAVAALETYTRSGERRLLLVIDDFHLLHGTEAQREVGLLVDYAPAGLAVVIASRARPEFDVSRRRLSGTVIEVGPDDLRFRSWEVERLFHDVYGEPLPPEDLAALTRRTEGWAAGLQLFHLATAGKPTPERRRALAALGARWKPAHEYLSANVLADLPKDLRAFLVDSCILPRLDPSLCDALLGRTDSAALLGELERRQIFVDPLDEIGSYRYHEVLRSFLEAVFVDRFGEAWARDRHRRAGELLEAAGYAADALAAYARAGDWEGVGRLLGEEGESAVSWPFSWLDLLPDALVANDPWLLLATARERVAAGRFAEAVQPYVAAEGSFGTEAGSEIARRERATLRAWLEPAFAPAGEWAAIARNATVREPLAASRAATSCRPQHRAFVAGFAALLAGQLDEAGRRFRDVRSDADASAQLAAAARLGAGVALLLADDPEASAEVEAATDEADALGMRWLARLGRASLALGDRPGGAAEAASAQAAAAGESDSWGEAYAAFAAGWGALRTGAEAGPVLEAATAGFHGLGAGVPEAWARSALALARVRAGDPDARDAALAAEDAARAAGVPRRTGLRVARAGRSRTDRGEPSSRRRRPHSSVRCISACRAHRRKLPATPAGPRGRPSPSGASAPSRSA